MPIRDEVILDIQQARRQIDEIAYRLAGAVTGVTVDLDTAGVADAIDLLSGKTISVGVDADTSGVAAEVARVVEGIPADVEVGADTRLAETELDRFRDEQKRQGIDLGLGDALGAAAFVAGTRTIIQAASDAEQAVGGMEVVFGAAALSVADFTRNADVLAGLSTTAAQELTTGLGGALKGLGFDLDQAAQDSIRLAVLGADLAATFGGTTELAVEGIKAALRGEFETLEQFNVFLKQSTVDAKAVELGLAGSTAAVDNQARAQATLALIYEQSAAAAGQFHREFGTAAVQAQVEAAQAANAAAELGDNLLPLYAQLTHVAGIAAEAIGALPGPIQVAGISLVGFGAVARPLKAGIDVLSSGFDLLKARAIGADGGLRGVASRAGVAATEIGLLITATQLLADQADHVDVTKLENALLDLTGAGTVRGVAADAFGEDLHKLSAAVEEITAPSVATRIEHFSGALNRALGDTDDDLSQARARVEDLDQALTQLAGRNPGTAAEALDAITEALTPDAARRLLGLLDDYQTALASIDTGNRTAAPSIAGVTEQLDLQEEAARLTTESLDRYRAGFESAFLDQDLEAALDRRTQDLIDLAAAVAEHGRSLAGDTEVGLANRDMIRELTQDVGDIITRHREAGASLEDLQSIRYLEITNLRNQLTQLSFNREEIDRYIASIEEIPLTRDTTLTIDADQALAEIEAIKQALSGLPAGFSAGAAINLFNLQQRRAGGQFGPGWRLVGEAGPELEFVDYSGFVVDAATTRAAMDRMTSQRLQFDVRPQVHEILARSVTLDGPVRLHPDDIASIVNGLAGAVPRGGDVFHLGAGGGAATTPKTVARRLQNIAQDLNRR